MMACEAMMGSGPDQQAHEQPEIVPGDVDQIALMDVLPAPQPRPCGLLEGIKRTGADVAVHDPECSESRAGGQPGSMVFGQCSRLRSLGHS